MIAVLGLVVGVVAGLLVRPEVPAAVEPYLPIAVVAALDAVFGGLRAGCGTVDRTTGKGPGRAA